MSGCEAIRERAQAYLDSELEPREREHFEAHVGACPVCRRVLADYRRLFARLGQPAVPAVPARFVAATMARVAAGERRRQARQTWVAAAAMLLVGSAALLLAWEGVPEGLLAPAQGLASPEVWRGVWESVVALGEATATSGGEWLSLAPGGAAALAVVLAMLGADVLLVVRWRALARVSGGKQTRVVR